MSGLFEWMATPGPTEEITMLVLVAVIFIALPIWIKTLKISKISKSGIEFDKDSEKTEDKEKNPQAMSDKSTDNSQSSGNLSITASQDYKLFSLILRDFGNRVKNEIKKYCKDNGINLKGIEEYGYYIDGKKQNYFYELKEFFQAEYTTYDLVSNVDIIKILENSKDYIFKKIDLLYKKIRTISIEEHDKINKKYEGERRKFQNGILGYIESIRQLKDDENKIDPNNTIDLHYTEYREILLAERISILDKQISTIEDINISVKRHLLEEFEKVYIEKKSGKKGE